MVISILAAKYQNNPKQTCQFEIIRSNAVRRGGVSRTDSEAESATKEDPDHKSSRYNFLQKRFAFLSKITRTDGVGENYFL